MKILSIEAWVDTGLNPETLSDEEIDALIRKVGATDTDYYQTLQLKIPYEKLDVLREELE